MKRKRVQSDRGQKVKSKFVIDLIDVIEYIQFNINTYRESFVNE